MSKKILLSVSLLVACAFVSVSVNAQDHKDHKKDPEKYIKKLDANNDGKISKDEADKAEKGKLKDHFAKVDVNKDGFIDKAELETYWKNKQAAKEAKKQQKS
ncbi:EF-hand domain-containing protein [Chitinophaga silvisoli]|uniref:EF-hand domain-containing protein n=1 Tax=Chitinophaga silvisoli TaxID=2291814 RepID=A0A3E1P3M3_9BACT|nr:EF-hand domain-containing protein [Chitinophaga silvisoli]RFM34767.1 EF-hand domain-containing protein [Chitinophaga silvisoli]